MKTDLFIVFPKDSTDSFTVQLLLFADDGYLYQVRVKNFDHPFRASDMDSYVRDWETWRIASKEEMAEIREVRKQMKEADNKEKQA